MTRPTLVSLAQELGVSRQTVSNVINQPHLVRESTRIRVQKAIEASGYRPSAAAQALRNQKSRTLGVRLHSSSDAIDGAVTDRFLHCVVEESELLSHRVMLFSASDDQREAETLLDLIESNTVDACLLTGTTNDDSRIATLEKAGVRFAVFGRPWGNESAATHMWAGIDGREGLRMATQYLVDVGHRRIGFIGWPEGSVTGDERHRGWRQAMLESFPSIDAGGLAAMSVRLADGVAEGAEAMDDLLTHGCDAVVCASDSLALGAAQAMGSERGQSGFVPVIGFDDTPAAKAMGLSSLAQPVDIAARLLVRRLIAPTAPPPDADRLTKRVGQQGHLLAPELRLRRSELWNGPLRGGGEPSNVGQGHLHSEGI